MTELIKNLNPDVAKIMAKREKVDFLWKDGKSQAENFTLHWSHTRNKLSFKKIMHEHELTSLTAEHH